MTLLSFQPSLFSGSEGSDMSFDGLVRHQVDQTSWLDYVPGWLHDHGELFDELLRDAPWQQRTRHMYDALVLEPRMVAWWDLASTLPDRLAQIRTTLTSRYRVPIDSTLVNLYRDGRDSVAWHGDTVRKRLGQPLVFTVSLGHCRRFLVRPRGGRTVLELRPGEGDLVVMGGRMQHDYEHTVPKELRVSGARMSITMRHSVEANHSE
jgi:alkylated DNA repair dioxygenase AlkB